MPDLRPDLEASGYIRLSPIYLVLDNRITTELWCLVVWSALGSDYYTTRVLVVTKFSTAEQVVHGFKKRQCNCKDKNGYLVTFCLC